MSKRIFDFCAALAGLILLSPLFLILAVVVWLYDFSSPLFIHQRIGKNGVPFAMLKFRTMSVNSEKRGPAITASGDPRITRVGGFLRATKLDELPQLWNVLVGDMSFVGPRPEVEKYVKLYSHDQRFVLSVRPGITDPASFVFFNEQDLLAQQSDPEKYYCEYLMGEKILINLEYLRRANFWSDLKLILATLRKIFSKVVPWF